MRLGGESVCENCTYVGMWNYKTNNFQPQMDHLVCFMPWMLALGAEGETREEDMELAERLMETCYRMYSEQPTGLAPEICSFRGKGVTANAQVRAPL